MDLSTGIATLEAVERKLAGQTRTLANQLDSIAADAERQYQAIVRETKRLKALGEDVTPMELYNAGGLHHVMRPLSLENITATMTRIVAYRATITAVKPLLDSETK